MSEYLGLSKAVSHGEILPRRTAAQRNAPGGQNLASGQSVMYGE